MAAVLEGRADPELLDSYEAERIPAAEENILHSTRSTDFISPKNAVSRVFRDATLELAADHAFARALVNSGRLSRAYCPPQNRKAPLGAGAPCPDAPLTRGNRQACGPPANLKAPLHAGAPWPVAPLTRGIRPAWLLHLLQGGFFGIFFTDAPLSQDNSDKLGRLADGVADLQTLVIATANSDCPALWQDKEDLFRSRYAVAPGSFILVRPDQHVVASWPLLDCEAVTRAHAAALALK